MFGMTIGKCTARGMAVGALILSISATTFGGSANAAPAADETTSCSTLAHARNESVHRLHDAWKGFRDQLKDLAHQARELERDSRHSKSATEMTGDARSEVADARVKLQEIWGTAHEKLQSLVELGQACKDTDTEDKDETTSSNTTANTTAASSTKMTEDKDEDKNENNDEDRNEEKDEDSATSSKTTTSTTTASTTTGPSTAELVAKYKEVVDQAIKDMQAVLDDVTAAVAKMTTAPQSTDSSMTAMIKAVRAKEKDSGNCEHCKSD